MAHFKTKIPDFINYFELFCLWTTHVLRQLAPLSLCEARNSAYSKNEKKKKKGKAKKKKKKRENEAVAVRVSSNIWTFCASGSIPHPASIESSVTFTAGCSCLPSVSVQCSSVKDRIHELGKVYMRSTLSHRSVSSAVVLKQFHSDQPWCFLVLPKKIVEHFFFLFLVLTVKCQAR